MAGKTSDNRVATASGDKSRWAHCAALGTVCALIIGFFSWSAESGLKELLSFQPSDSYYNLLVQGFRSGQLNVKREAPPGLAQLANPRDWETDKPYLLNAGSPIYDMSYYKGKLYLYFGITPALVLFWPYVALTGHYLLHKQAVVIFCSVGFLAGVWLLWALWRRYFAELGFGVVVAGALALGLGAGTPLLLQECDFYEVAVSCGYALTMLALVGIWKALHEPGRRGWWLAAASLAYGLAVGARPNLLFGAVILLVPVVQSWREGRRVWPVLMGAVLPIGVIGLGLMLYNYLRFDNPLEFGMRYALPSDLNWQTFRPRYFWFNFRVYFLEAARWGDRFPYIRDIAAPPLPPGYRMVDAHISVLSNLPVVWLALAAPLAWRGRSAVTRSVLRCFVAALALLFGICVLTLCLFFGLTFRYEMDFLPKLGLLAVIGIFGLEHALAERRVWRNAVRWGWGVLLAVSVAFNLFASYDFHADFLKNLGCSLLAKGQMNEGIAQLQKALEIRPNWLEAHRDLGIAFLQEGHMAEAMAHFKRVVELQPDSALDHLNFAIALAQAGEIQEAVTQCQKAIQCKPGYVEARIKLGSIFLELGRLSEAQDEFSAALKINPHSAMGYYSLANVLDREGRRDEAIKNYQEAIQLEPGYSEAHNNLGNILAQRGKMEEAAGQFRAALQYKPDNASAQGNLGVILVAQGRFAEAIACFQKAAELQPNDPGIQKQLAWLLATSPDAALRNGPKAIQMAQQANQLTEGGDPVMLCTLAAAYAENGQFPEAVATARRALQLAAAQNNAALTNALAVQLKFYQAGAPFRDAHLTNAPASSTQDAVPKVGK